QVTADAMLPKPRPVIKKEGCHRQSGRNCRRHRGRFKTGNDPNQIHEQDKDEECTEERDVLRAAVLDGVMRLAAHEHVNDFENMLELARMLDAEARTQE